MDSVFKEKSKGIKRDTKIVRTNMREGFIRDSMIIIKKIIMLKNIIPTSNTTDAVAKSKVQKQMNKNAGSPILIVRIRI